jgi:RHS repeat-associated protein
MLAAVCANTEYFSRSRITGKERDTESGNDYFGARYYASSMGRFLSPDPKQITKQRMADPQQWNMYAYTRNNPLVAIDPGGKELRFVNQEQANRALGEFRAAVTPAQRSAISLGTKDGHIVMQVDAAAAKAAGDSNLGRLGFVTSSDKVAQFEYRDSNAPIAATLNRKSVTTTLTDSQAGGITLPDSSAKGYYTSPDPGKTEVIMDNEWVNAPLGTLMR